MYSLDFRAHSEVGLVRKNNQDSGYASPTALVIADGMGGAAAGDLASAVAIHQVVLADGAHTDDELVPRLRGAMRRANELITELVASDHTLDGMGTTFCGAFFSGTQLGVVHIGDSRGYLFRDGTLSRLTHDHSWVQSLVDEGKITEDEALVHPHRSLVLKVLNGHPNHEPDTFTFEVHEGDVVLFCSDGLCGFTTDAVIAHALGMDDLDAAMEVLVRAAHDGGGADNITISMARVVPQDDLIDVRPPLVLGAADELGASLVPGAATGSPVAAVADGAGAEASPDDGSSLTPLAPSPPSSSGGASAAGVVLDETEVARYSPTLDRPRPWRGIAITLLGLVVLAGLGFGGYRWSQAQYYIADNAGTVAVYQGVRVPVLTLSHLSESTDIVTAELPRYHRERVRASFSLHSAAEAENALAELRRVAGTCAPADPSASATPSSTPTATPSSTATATPSSTASASTSSSPSPSGTPSGSPSASVPGPVPGSSTPAATAASSGSITNGEC
ncbi:PP2C-family Ser/Thr phosphatase [Aestuariimicrobium sp. T2.26MG-19.2B]|uniref:PP2C family protein-serine/threonine phosphatase n=1 Tax=Aestuariimicrobium sp. T2.26MG-19.2B TaxID=3040679 RepID=UPI0024773592|nr:protein phosphatase 2C domain-containing protein [Aestuariimicrobium sp. T2.26MG-19.2B]CAI9404672.1 PP2C-family Ser/Thr phosphatase [Aestuariimicrobium sp. T2.26MG-19.2B]